MWKPIYKESLRQNLLWELTHDYGNWEVLPAGFRASAAPRPLLGGQDFSRGNGGGGGYSGEEGMAEEEADKEPATPAELRTAGKEKVSRLVNKVLWSYIPGDREEWIISLSFFQIYSS